MIVQRYSFPGGLRFELQTSDPQAAAFFEGEYGWARGASEADSLLTLHWHRARWPSSRSPEESIHNHKLLARWAYRVTGGGDRLDYQVRGNRWALPMVHHMLVHHGLRFLASHREVLFLHAAAVERDGSSVLLTGSGGAGKTTTSALILARGDEQWRYHADDYVIVEPHSGRSFAYPSRAHVYADLLRSLPEIAGQLTWRERMRARAFSALRRWSAERIKWPTRVELGRLWPERDLAEQAEVAGVVILGPAKSEQVELLDIPGGEIPLDELLEINFFEARHFIHLLEKAGFWRAHPNRLESWRDAERHMLQELSRQVPFWRLPVPTTAAAAAAAPGIEAALLGALAREKVHK